MSADDRQGEAVSERHGSMVGVERLTHAMAEAFLVVDFPAIRRG